MTAADLVPLIADLLPADGKLVIDDPAVADAVRTHLPRATVGRSSDPGPDAVDGVLLLAGEVAVTDGSGSVIIDAAVRRCRPGGIVAVAMPSAVYNAAKGQTEAPGLSATQLQHLLAERGLDVLLVAAPGASARLAGRPWAYQHDLAADRTPGLLDAGPIVLAVGQTARSAAERTQTFFSSIARKIVSASALCRDENDRILVVFDSFKQQWTLPGGLIDADENPVDAAVREVFEEGGVTVHAGDLLGIFAHSWPDRINLIYAATPVTGPGQPLSEHPVPIHSHEIDEVRWVDGDDALTLLDGDWPCKVTACLQHPGKTWRY